MQSTIKNRTIFCKDNLDILQGINSNSIDLIYLDPPFNKKKVFTAPIDSSAEGASFSDIFKEEDVKDEWLLTIKEDYDNLYKFLTNVKDLSTLNNKGKNRHYLYNYCYLSYMAIRLIECFRVLKDTGSLYLHCDPTMSHYLKIVLDCLFGEKNFKNEIVWQRNDKRGKGSQHEAKKFGANTDTILFYTKSNMAYFSPHIDLGDEKISIKFNKIDENGRRYYKGIPIFCSKSMDNRPNLCYEWRGYKNPYPSGWRLSKERLEEEYQKGNIVIREDGKLERRKYLDDYKGKPVDNNWIDISRVIESEHTGYPTQKPLSLLERIISASSNYGDVVLDPFCGCATTCIAAEKLGRRWIGVDVSLKAYELVKERLEKEVSGRAKKTKDIDLWKWKNEVHHKIIAPKRTDIKGEYKEKKYIYVISNKAYKGEYKVGIAKDYKSRLNSYQTSDPNRGYKLEYKILTTNFRALEEYIHKTFENRHEWVRANLKDIIRAIEGFEKQIDT